MNKIEEIAVEAGLIVGEYNGFDRGMLTAAELRFAELIVKKTMQVAANNLPQNVYLDVAEAVIEHFGVNE